MDSTQTDDNEAWAEARRQILKAGMDALRPRPRLSINEIAQRHRIIPSETSSSAGRYSPDLTPYVREIQDRLHPDDPAQVIVYEAAAQAGAKSTIAENWVLAVAGTHGKTTTSAMTATILAHAGADPSYVIGSPLAATGRSAHLGSGDVLVIEADESDGSFLQYPTELSLIHI